MTNAHVMGPRLHAGVATDGRGGCHVLDAKYEPGVRCSVLYRAGDRLIRGDLLEGRAGDADDSRPVVDPGVRLSLFPDDPDLPTLRYVVADPATLRDALGDALPTAGRILRCRTELLRYRPGRRATLGVEVRRPPGHPVQRLVVKSYHDGGKAAAVAAEAVLLEDSVDPAAVLRFAPVRAHLPDLSLVVQQHVSGLPLDEVLRMPGPFATRGLQRAAVALAELHSRTGVSRRRRDIDAEVTRFATRAARVAEVNSGTGAAVVGLAVRLAATAQDVPPGVVGLVHGDCKPSQFLLRGEREVVLLDLDSCGQADPAVDVGTFLATLRQRTLKACGGRAAGVDAQSSAFARVFLRTYVAAAGTPSDGHLRHRIAWYEAVALERKALRTFARAPRSPLTRALVEHGHACLDGLGGIR
jgi:hypothetical protein